MTLNGIAWDWSRRGVENVRRFFQEAGHYVLDVDAIERGGAPAIIGQVRRHITPDLQVSRDGTTRWVEVKYKNHCVKYQKTGRWRHGIDLSNWQAYQQVERQTGIPGFLAIFQERPGPEAPPEPMLLVAPFTDLIRGDIVQTGYYATNPMIFWNVDDFQVHPLEAGQMPDLACLTRVIHPWEQRSSEGHAPRWEPSPYSQEQLF